MIIAIDAYEANVPDRVGIGRYAYEILCHMYLELEAQFAKGKLGQSNLRVRVYLPKPPLSDLPPETSWWKYQVVGPGRLWTFLGLPWHLLTEKPRPDVVFSPTHYVPRFTGIPRVMSIMDLSYLSYPAMFRPKDLHQLTEWTKYSVEHSARILTISRFSKNAILKAYGVPEDRVVVTYPGLTPLSNNNMTKKYNLSQNFILSVGTLQPRKNYGNLIAAFSKIRDKFVRQFPDLELVIVGKKGWLYDEILAAPEKYNVEKQVRFLNFVPDADLPALYETALCFALPSLYEGFGLPVLEALAHDCPVVISNVSSLPEIAGNAGILVDPNIIDSIGAGLTQALNEHGTEAKKKRIAAGRAQAGKFTWEKAAKQTLEVLEVVAKQK